MDGTRVYYAKQNKSVRERQILYDFTHVGFKKQNKQVRGKKDKTNQQTLNYREQTDGYQMGGGWGNG